ncbi:MAG: NAD(P)/FAD-dependent oxidoreductase [Lachnospiraceae bacterium]|nr:NAD(P)/FAD-dependent oxidoreductase [Lachnospiraceae bacterium]
MNYDYIIIGGSVAGSICAYDLCKKGYRCLVLEQNAQDHEKICGGGVSFKALDMLIHAGIEIEPLLSDDLQMISGHVIFKDDKSIEKVYKDGKSSIGIQRNIFDGFLRKQAQKMGAVFCFEHKVSKVMFSNGRYTIDGYSGDRLIWAIGARTLDGEIPYGQSIGISGQVKARVDLRTDRFYYWYYEPSCETKYFWAFPIGRDLWNVGIWSREAFPQMRYEYEKCMDSYFLPHKMGEWNYLRSPKAEFLGHYDQRKDHEGCLGVGDFAGMCNPVNGGGIIGAIQSALSVIA